MERANLNTDLEAEKESLLEIHRRDRQAHFDRDVDLLLSHSASEFISVTNGQIHRSTPAEVKAFFQEYFKGATYYEWDDLEPPIIRISADASMAWMIVRTQVRRTTQLEGPEEARETKFIYAGIMTYEKRDGKWLRVANVSTFG